MMGNRLSLATIQRHNQNINDVGIPTYNVEDDWVAVVVDWPCDVRTTSEDETTRGRQTTFAETVDFVGDPYSIRGVVDTNCRIVVDGTAYSIRKIHGTDVMSLEATITASRETQ